MKNLKTKKNFKIYLLGLFSFCISCSTEENLLFEYVDPLQKVFPESAYFPSLKAEASAARGEHVSFQFSVRADNSIEDLSIEVISPSNGNESLNEVKTGFVDFVRLGRKNPGPSHDSFNSVSGYYPDPIIYEDRRNVPGAQTQPVWISVKVPTDCQTGIYRGEIKVSGKIKGNKFVKAHAVEIEVFKPVIEKTSLWVTNWIHLDRLEYLNNNQNVEKYSDLYWELIREFARTLSSYRQNVVMLSPFEYTEFTFESNKWEFDFSNFNEMVSIFKNEGVIGRLEGGHFGSRLFGGWADPFGLFVPELDSDSITKELLPLSDHRTQKFYQAFLPAFYKNIELNGWENQFIQHIADEPIDANVESYIEISKFIKRIVPDIKIIEACHTNQLSGMIDIWVPQLNYLNEDLDFYLERKVKNDEVWFYTCLWI